MKNIVRSSSPSIKARVPRKSEKLRHRTREVGEVVRAPLVWGTPAHEAWRTRSALPTSYRQRGARPPMPLFRSLQVSPYPRRPLKLAMPRFTHNAPIAHGAHARFSGAACHGFQLTYAAGRRQARSSRPYGKIRANGGLAIRKCARRGPGPLLGRREVRTVAAGSTFGPSRSAHGGRRVHFWAHKHPRRVHKRPVCAHGGEALGAICAHGGGRVHFWAVEKCARCPPGPLFGPRKCARRGPDSGPQRCEPAGEPLVAVPAGRGQGWRGGSWC